MANKKQLTPRLNRLEPNIVIDGGMEIWPEGTSRSIPNNTGLYGGSLWNFLNSGTGITVTNSQQASIPSGTNIPFSNQVSKTASGSVAAGTRSRFFYGIEGYDANRLINDEFSVIFWVKSSVASNRSISIANASGSHSYVQQYNIASANTWQLVSVKFPALSTCPGTLDKTNGIGLSLRFNVVSGSTYQTGTLNSWQSGDFLSGLGEDTTWITGTNHDFSIAGVMVLPGDFRSLSTNTSSYRFMRSGKNFQEEMTKTQRYYAKSYDTAVTPGTASVGGAIAIHSQVANQPLALQAVYPVEMRTTPTLTGYNPSTGSTSTAIRGFTGGANLTHSVQGSTARGAYWLQAPAAAIDYYIMHWTADARF